MTDDSSSRSEPVEPAAGRSAVIAGRTFVALAAVLLPVMVLVSFDYGVTWDELSRHRYGMRVWDFVRGLEPRSAFLETGGHVYPGLFDSLCAALANWIPLNRFVVRHMANATFGWIGIVYCGRLARRLFGPWAGVLGLVLLALSPRYFAHSMNNPKDLPFAAMSVVALYYISTVSARWPYVPPSTAIKIAVSLALALGVRVGALLYLGYFGVLVAVLLVLDRCTNWRRLAGTAMTVAAIAIATLLLGTVFWPWAGGKPLTRPFEALLGAANYPWNGGVLFMGAEYPAQELPWYYAPWWFAISAPPVVLAGAALSPFFTMNRADTLRRAGLWVVAIAPLAATIIMSSTLYDGVRHLLFIYPVLVVLAAGGWTGLLRRLRPPGWRVGAALALAAGMAGMLIFVVRSHPNQVVYFNVFVGGPRDAFRQYELDYWGNCMLQGVRWGAAMARAYGARLTIAGDPEHLVSENLERFPELEFGEGSENRHHFEVKLVRGARHSLRTIVSNPALYRVETPDGAVLCTVRHGPALGELDEDRRRAAAREATLRAARW